MGTFEYIGEVVIIIFCLYLLITNLIAISFIASTPGIESANPPLTEASYIGIGSTIVVAAIGFIYYIYDIKMRSKYKIPSAFNRQYYVPPPPGYT